jgi:hypothetical protein
MTDIYIIFTLFRSATEAHSLHVRQYRHFRMVYSCGQKAYVHLVPQVVAWAMHKMDKMERNSYKVDWKVPRPEAYVMSTV